MRNARNLVEAVACWLHYEQCCQREVLFDEAYMSYPVGQYLQSQFGARVQTEYEHPVLAAAKEGQGDKPRVDFVVVERGKVLVAVETKWLSKSKTLIRDILVDCIRLEMLAYATGADAYLVVAGTKKSFLKLFSDPKVQGAPLQPNSARLFPQDKSEARSVTLDKPSKHWEKLFGSACVRLPETQLPERLLITKTTFFKPSDKGDDFWVYGWGIKSLRLPPPPTSADPTP